MFYYSLLLTSVFFELLVFGYFGPKNRAIKISNIHKDFELYQLFCAKISQYSFYTYCLQSTQFGSEVLGQFDIEKSIVYKSGVLAHFAPWGIFGLGSISTS